MKFTKYQQVEFPAIMCAAIFFAALLIWGME